MNKLNISHDNPVLIISEGKYSQRLRIWQEEDGIINFKIETEKGDIRLE